MILTLGLLGLKAYKIHFATKNTYYWYTIRIITQNKRCPLLAQLHLLGYQIKYFMLPLISLEERKEKYKNLKPKRKNQYHTFWYTFINRLMSYDYYNLTNAY